MNDFKKLEERYFNDATFHHVVKQLYRMIEDMRLSPDEVRQAALFAAFKFEMLHAKPFIKIEPGELRVQAGVEPNE